MLNQHKASIAVEHPQEFSSSDYFHEWPHIIEHIHDWDWISQELGLWVVWVLLSPYTPISLFWFHSMKLGLASSQETFMLLDTDLLHGAMISLPSTHLH